MNDFTIRDLENLSGIRAHTIRVWEQRYNFLKPRRTQTNIRYYCNDELKTVLNIALLNKCGFKISHIDRMGSEEIGEKIDSLKDANAIQERMVNKLLLAMAELNMESFEKLIDEHINERGIEYTVIHVLLPFLEKTGILWQTGQINPAQEHLVSGIIRQKLIVAIEVTASQIQLNKTVLLFLPEGEHHELGLLFMYYLLKCRGARTIYLGANVPLRDVEHVIDLKKPDFAFIHLTATATNFNFEKFLSQLHKQLPATPVVISGQLTQHYSKKTPPNVHFKRSLFEVTGYLSAL
jgi:DNA-binding transcriptional MerR regulator